MELLEYFRLLRKWAWLLFIGAFLAGGASYLFNSQEVDVYNSSVTIMVGSAIDAPNPEYSELITGSQLANTYAILARSYDIAQAAVEAGNFPVSAGQLRGMIWTSVVENTPLLVVGVTYTDPILAAEMVTEVANQLVINSPSNLPAELEAQIEVWNAEVERLRTELQDLRLQRGSLDAQIRDTTDPDTLAELREQRNEMTNQINQASGNIAAYTRTIADLQRRVNSLTIVEQARISGSPQGQSPINSAVLGAMVGAALAAGLALLVEYLDDTFKSPSEVTQALNLPTLAAISRFGKTRDEYAQRLVTYNDPGSPISEEYRTLRTNLLFSSNGNTPNQAYVITSPGPSEGKSVTAANLAVTMASAGWRVLLIDADLRRPRIHEVFDLSNERGLSSLLAINPNELAANGNGARTVAARLSEVIQPTMVPGLSALTSGPLPLNPTEVLGSASMQRWLDDILAADLFDILLFDTPPALVVADSPVLASALKAPVILVVEAKGTRRHAAQRVIDQLAQLEIEIKGIVLNAVNRSDQGLYGYEYNYYYYYYTDSRSRSGRTPRNKKPKPTVEKQP